MSKIGQTFSFLIPVITFAALVVFMAGCEREEISRAEELKAACNLLVEECWNNVNLDVCDEHYAADIVYHYTPYPDIEGLEAVKQFITDVHITYPDIKFTIDEIIVEGETTAVRWTMQCTHTGQSPILDIAPTGKQVTMMGCNVFHWAEGKVVEDWAYLDHLGLFQQLGFELVPPQEEAVEESKEESQ